MFRPLESLSPRGRLHRLRTLLKAHIPAWDLAPGPPRLLVDGFNTTFIATSTDGQRVVLRVHRPGWRSAAMIASELAWLEHLAATTDIIAPLPFRTRDGATLVRATTAGIPDGRFISALRFVPGRLVGAHGGPHLATEIGWLAARLHASTVDLPCAIDSQPAPHGLYTMIPRVWPDLPQAILTERRRNILLAAETRIAACLASLDGAPTTRLCHLDLHPHNLVRTPSGALAPIDFDDCAHAHPALDLGIALHYLRAHNPDQPMTALCDALLGAYATRATPPADTETLCTLADARQLMLLNQLCTETNPKLAAALAGYVELTETRLAQGQGRP